MGKVIRSWEDFGAIHRRNQWIATAGVAILLATNFLLLPASLVIKGVISALALGTLGYVWTRPQPPL